MRKTQVIPKPILSSIDEQSEWGLFAVHTFTVPPGKRWVIKYIKMTRSVSGVMEIGVEDLTTNTLGIRYIDDVQADWEFDNILILPAGWKIKCVYSATANNFMESQLLYEEDYEY